MRPAFGRPVKPWAKPWETPHRGGGLNFGEIPGSPGSPGPLLRSLRGNTHRPFCICHNFRNKVGQVGICECANPPFFRKFSPETLEIVWGGAHYTPQLCFCVIWYIFKIGGIEWPPISKIIVWCLARAHKGFVPFFIE